MSVNPPLPSKAMGSARTAQSRRFTSSGSHAFGDWSSTLIASAALTFDVKLPPRFARGAALEWYPWASESVGAVVGVRYHVGGVEGPYV